MEIGRCNVKVVREDLNGRRHLSQNIKEVRWASLCVQLGNSIPVGRTARLKALGHECAWDSYVHRTARKPEWLNWGK